ncbi:hypothetical protein [Variovorax sp. AFSI2.2]|uniref:hypothetical protein n=1 Tax=Variovorax sp. AFSI2.2 TaxID=3384160 RepID=UPI003EB8476A
MANNTQVKSYPELLPALPALLAAYAQYEAVSGNAHFVQQIGLTNQQKDFLRAHYKSPPTALGFIKTLRAENSHKICPMCGSTHRGTLDHLLPKDGSPEFAVFSRNLVPACNCNTKRATNTVGPLAGQRVLHPYYDKCLASRLIAARFDDLGRVPKVTVRLRLPVARPEHAAVAFHLETVISKTDIQGFLATRWTKMCRRPASIIRDFRVRPPSPKALRRTLVLELRELDEEHEGRNNWKSVFVAGLLDSHVIAWLYTALNRPGRLVSGPLIDA